jgi:pimeloyl-ACP methyl ester carboxylesterase
MRWAKTTAATALTVTGAGAAALYLGRRVSDLAVRPPNTDDLDHRLGAGPLPLDVLDVSDGAVTLERGPGADDPGSYALRWADGGRAVTGEVLRTTPDTVTRRLTRVDSGVLHPAERVRLSPQLHTGGPAVLGLDHREVTVQGELGPIPAWYTPGVRNTWVITAHGLGTDRDLTVNLLPALGEFRLPVLSIAYRGDPDAPAAPDGLSRLGATEWQDLAAAVRTAREGGARHVVLLGWSVGATMALHTAARPELHPLVSGLVLDSPVLDWRTVLRGRAAQAGVPGPLVPLGMWATEGRTGLVPGGDLEPPEDSPGPVPVHRDYRAQARPSRRRQALKRYRITVPTLLLHSPDDPLADAADTRELADRFPGLASYVEIPGAGHGAGWNADRGRYEEALRRFLTSIV